MKSQIKDTISTTLRLDSDVHAIISETAKQKNISINKYIIDNIFCNGDIISTNENWKSQLRINFTKISDLIAMGRYKSFNAMIEMMVDAIEHEEQVIFEKHFSNHPPVFMKEYTSVEEIRLFQKKMLALSEEYTEK